MARRLRDIVDSYNRLNYTLSKGNVGNIRVLEQMPIEQYFTIVEVVNKEIEDGKHSIQSEG